MSRLPQLSFFLRQLLFRTTGHHDVCLLCISGRSCRSHNTQLRKHYFADFEMVNVGNIAGKSLLNHYVRVQA